MAVSKPSKRIDYPLEKEMDRAVMFLCQAFSQSGHNEKPVIGHSIRVGMTLYDWGFSQKIVLAGFLHDILEDTDCSAAELEKNFGAPVTKLVQASTLDPRLMDKRAQTRDLFQRCREAGFAALAVKCADILDNIDYFVPTKGYEALAELLMEKYHLFLNVARPVLGNEPIFRMLEEKVRAAEKKMAAFQ